MKKILVLLAAMTMAVGTANAQMVSSQSSVTEKKVSAGKDYNRVEVGYAPMFMTEMFFWGNPTTTAHGVMAGYARGFHLSKKWPMYIEAGGQVQYNHKHDSGLDRSVDLLRLNIPVSFTWRFGIGKEKQFKIAPYLGLNFGINMLYNMDGENMFKDNDDIYSANRFQLGMVEGINLTYKCWTAGIGYAVDFMSLDKSDFYNASNSTGSLIIRVGYEF